MYKYGNVEVAYVFQFKDLYFFVKYINILRNPYRQTHLIIYFACP